MNNLIGLKTKYGSIVIEYAKFNSNSIDRWKLQCVCGVDFFARERSFLKDKISLCPTCKANKIKTIKYNYEGQQFGRLIVLFDSGKRRNADILYECVCQCGKIKLISSSCLRRKTTNSCGCLKKEMNQKRFSKTYKIPNNRKSTHKTRAMAKYIYTRDNFRCIICQSKKNLNAHHMDGWKWCEKRRYDETNLITLCGVHHKEFHNKYGSGTNTEEQFVEFYSKFSNNYEIFNHIKRYKENNGFSFGEIS